MGMVIDIGLERYFNSTEKHQAAVRQFVDNGLTRRLRDFVGTGVYEARRQANGVVAGYLSDEESERIHKDYAALKENWVDFSWNQLDRMGAYFIRTLAVPRLQAEGTVIRFEGCDYTVDLTNLERSYQTNWRGHRTVKGRRAGALHRFAASHDFLVHSE